ncbi:MAG TPA: spherulation-specific family 4 protein [Herpetosiphonaceae bacterium]
MSMRIRRSPRLWLIVLLTLCTPIFLSAPAAVRAAITGQSATNTSTTVTYTYSWTGAVALRDVFIDTNQQASNGFAIGGIGAEYLVQDAWLYRFTGATQTTWSWSAVKQVTFSPGSPATWTVNRADIQETNLCAEASDLIFRTEDTAGNTVDMSARYTHLFTKDSSCLQPLRLGLASYYELGSNDWTEVVNSGSAEVAFALVNPDSGPGSAKSTQWEQQIAQLHAKGIQVYGYIRSRQSGAGTRARPAAEYVADIDKWYIWYGRYLTGLFIDEEYPSCTSNLGPNGETNWNEAQYYKNIVAYMKQSRNAYAPTGGVKVILNPGTTTQECMFTVNNTPNPAQDIIQANFETFYAQYGGWTPSGWETKYPKAQFWHLIHTATKAEMEAAINLARSRHVGYFYATDATSDANWVGCTINGQQYGTWNLLPGRCSSDTTYWPRLKALTD